MQLLSHVKDANVPVCSYCKFYKPSIYSDFYSDTAKCTKFGNKDIYTGDIHYDYVSSCRRNKEQCGLEGKLFEAEPNMVDKKLKHFVERYLPFFLVGGFVTFAKIISGF
jgi:hypothetical protein